MRGWYPNPEVAKSQMKFIKYEGRTESREQQLL